MKGCLYRKYIGGGTDVSCLKMQAHRQVEGCLILGNNILYSTVLVFASQAEFSRLLLPMLIA